MRKVTAASIVPTSITGTGCNFLDKTEPEQRKHQTWRCAGGACPSCTHRARV